MQLVLASILLFAACGPECGNGVVEKKWSIYPGGTTL
jgi:hypothetical protein